jgi:hypothetical protein
VASVEAASTTAAPIACLNSATAPTTPEATSQLTVPAVKTARHAKARPLAIAARLVASVAAQMVIAASAVKHPLAAVRLLPTSQRTEAAAPVMAKCAKGLASATAAPRVDSVAGRLIIAAPAAS